MEDDGRGPLDWLCRNPTPYLRPPCSEPFATRSALLKPLEPWQGRPEPEPPLPQPPRAPHPVREREAFVAHLRGLQGHGGPEWMGNGGMIPFGYVNRDETRMKAERQAQAERERVREARRERERRMGEPWPDGEWIA